MTDRGDEPELAQPSPPEPSEPPAATPPAATPLVAWEAPAPAYVPAQASAGPGLDTGYAGGPPPFDVGSLLKDCFAIYGADPLRFIAVAIVTSVVSLLGSFASSPFDLTRAAGASGLLGVLGFIVGVVGGAVTFALADAGPAMPFGRVFRRGVERAGWLFLTSLLIGIGFVVLFLVPAVVIVLAAIGSPSLAVVLTIVVMLALIWIGLRVALAIPANVVDNLNSIDALRLSWRVTRPAGVWARILGAGFLLGLLFVPALAGIGMASLVATLGGQPALLVVPTLALALFTPISSLLTYAAYRRLVAPIPPWWAAGAPSAPAAPTPAIDAPAPADALVTPDAPATPDASVAAEAVPAPDARPVFRARPFGTVARALVALMLAADLVGVVGGGWAIGELVGGRVHLPTLPGYPGFPGFRGLPGEVIEGTVAFGTASDLDTCTVTGQNVLFDSSAPIVWMAAFDRRITSGDEVFLRVTVDGTELETTLQDPGTYDCLGVEIPSTFDPGLYEFQLLVNGEVGARGTMLVQ